MKPVLRGLYVITDSQLLAGGKILPAVEAAIIGGARLVQYRDKSADSVRRKSEAHDLLRLCRRYQIPLIINDDVDLAGDIGAQGVHLGKHDSSLAHARAALGPEAIIGLSCYDDPECNIKGADYAAFGRFFSSTTKPDAQPASLETLQRARQQMSIPIAAIGGITATNGQQLRDAGADMLAVVAGVFAATDIKAAASAIAGLYADNSLSH